MNGFSRACMLIGLALLVTLLVLRFGWPELVVKQTMGYALGLTWPLSFFLGLGLSRGLNLGTGSLGSVIVSSSTAVVAGATNVFLKLGFFETAPTKQSIEMFCIAATPIVFLVWCIIQWRTNRK